MINYLKGKLIAKQPPMMTVETGDIGYLVEASMQTFYQLPDIQEAVFLHIHLLIKEEKPILYGFIQAEERRLFQELIKINTIGPKVALAILSNMDAHQLLQIVHQKNVQALHYIPGIGRKTAERLLLELSNRLPAWKPKGGVGAKVSDAESVDYSIQQDAISALIALGYKPQVVNQAINVVLREKESCRSLQDVIRALLLYLRKAD